MNIEDKKLIINYLLNHGIDIDKFILNGFTYYKRNHVDILKNSDYVDLLLSMYYDLTFEKTEFNNMKRSFVKKYIYNESAVEGVDILHDKEEVEGLKKMYEYMHSEKIEVNFDIFSIKDLHKKLFSCTLHPEFGGDFRRQFAYLEGAKTNLCDWTYIYFKLRDLDESVKDIRQISSAIKDCHNSRLILLYLDKCVKLGCELIKIHPFPDGNGRTIRCFVNKLMEDGGLPSIYIKKEEKNSYLSAMEKAIDYEDYSGINSFYRFKLCDSIIELDINERINSNDKNKTLKK